MSNSRDDVIALGKRKEIRSDRLKEFLSLYVENGGDPEKAFIDAGYQPSPGKAKKLIRENWQAVQDLVVLKVGGHAPFALDAIVKLASTAKSETVRLNAAKDLLSRAGYDASLKIETKNVEDMESNELEAELLALLKKTGTDVDKINIEH